MERLPLGKAASLSLLASLERPLGARSTLRAPPVHHLSPPLLGRIVEDFKRRAVAGPQPGASSPAELDQERFWIKRACAQPAQVRLVRPEGRHSLCERGGDVDTVTGVRRPRGPYLDDPVPGLQVLGEQLGEHPPIARIANRV